MAKFKKQSNVLLGYEDEIITEKHLPDVGYWTNKIGGHPDYPAELGKVSSPKCQLCNLQQPMILQIYAPLENSPFHRTLYIFGCINPNCWNQNESWTCLRCQSFDSTYESNAVTTAPVKPNVEWCTGADNWDDDNGNFENGNVITSNHQSDNDSDDSSSLSAGIGSLTVDECNANWGAACNVDKDPGAVGKQMSPTATAEIEGDESEVVCIDTPTVPQKDLIALLQESAPVPYRLLAGGKNKENLVSFISMFISVGEEVLNNPYTSDHVRELIQQYQQSHGDFLQENISHEGESYEPVTEKYEKCNPAHGDKMYHQFLTRIQQNPGHILRFSVNEGKEVRISPWYLGLKRGLHGPALSIQARLPQGPMIMILQTLQYGRDTGQPLLLYPLQETPKKCRYCGSDLVFEIQILPTLIPKLRLPDEDETHIEFGSVLIYTCKRSCWTTNDKFKLETVVVQMEKL